MTSTLRRLLIKEGKKQKREKEKKLTPEHETDPKEKRVRGITAKEGTKKKTIGETPKWGSRSGLAKDTGVTRKRGEIRLKGRKVAERWTRKAKSGSKIMQGYKAGGKV